MSIPTPDQTAAVLADLIFRGRKIEAIKLYRESTRVGLKEAKEAIEELEASLRQASPEKFTVAPRGKGCFGTAAVLGVCGAAIVWWWTQA
jgi:hypothetical protein